ncbi:MAG: hypothetical protein Q7R30_02480 [Acidobacteriota bacterium]|nr:hypothetical protein [Acidobacteriota bacterium]
MSLKKMQLKGGLTRAALLGVVLIGVLAGAMVLARRGPSVLAKTTAAQSPAENAPAAAPKQLLVAPAKGTGRTAKTTPSRPAAATPAAKPVVMAAATTPAVDAPASAVAQSPELISLTGCLQHDDGTFRLKDTAGADAPKSRNWKSGFLRKRAASVEVVDSANRLGLPTHVGQRVTVTGVLLNKEMRARAVQRVGVCS